MLYYICRNAIDVNQYDLTNRGTFELFNHSENQASCNVNNSGFLMERYV